MPRLEQTIDAVFSDRDITPSDVPQLDLYMDQVLTLFDRTLSESKRAPGDKLLTKTMVNNYVKEGLMTPVRGKKYTREQIMQLLCASAASSTVADDTGNSTMRLSASNFFSHARAFSIDIKSQSPFSSEGIASIMLSHRRRR